MTPAGSVDRAECLDSSSRAEGSHLWCPSAGDVACFAASAACFSASVPPAWWLTLLTPPSWFTTIDFWLSHFDWIFFSFLSHYELTMFGFRLSGFFLLILESVAHASCMKLQSLRTLQFAHVLINFHFAKPDDVERFGWAWFCAK